MIAYKNAESLDFDAQSARENPVSSHPGLHRCLHSTQRLRAGL